MKRRKVEDPTTIEVSREVLEKLRRLKVSRGDTYNDVIKRLIKKIERESYEIRSF